jgi:hypothetical protein
MGDPHELAEAVDLLDELAEVVEGVDRFEWPGVILSASEGSGEWCE